MTVYRLSDIKPDPVFRLETCFKELNCLYGSSEISGSQPTWGLPIGKISLWGGEGGIGKSRLALGVAQKYSQEGNKVLVIQTEASLSDFASWVNNSEDYPNLYCSGADTFQEILKAIYEVEPKLVVIDSINEVQEFNGRDASPIIKSFDGQMGANGEVLDPCTLGLREVISDVGAHCIVLAQLTVDGKIKGGTSLPHLVDAVVSLRSDSSLSAGQFLMEMGKNRYGSKGGVAVFEHTDDGVCCISSNRYKDDTWCMYEHGMSSSGLHALWAQEQAAVVQAALTKSAALSRIINHEDYRPTVKYPTKEARLDGYDYKWNNALWQKKQAARRAANIPPRPSYGDYPISKKTLDDIHEWDRLYDPETWAEMERAMAIGAAKIAHRNSPTHRAAGAIVNGIRSLGNLGGWLP